MRQIQVFDLDVRNNPGLQRFQLHSLGIRDRPALLLLAGEGFDLLLEIRHQTVGIRILADGFLGVVKALDDGMLLEHLPNFLRFVQNLLRIYGHVAPCSTGTIIESTVDCHSSTSERYTRQRVLPQIGGAGQRRLGSARVLLVGCGALGSTAADLLVRAGVGFLRIADRDLVELGNLQRQVLFDERDAAEQIPKAVAAQRRLSQINSSVRIESHVVDVNFGNIRRLADGIEFILDGTDNVATRYLLNDLAVERNIPWIYGGCVGVGGRMMAIWPGKTACLRCVFPDPPKASDLPTCDVAGILGPAAALVGAMQAAVVIRMIVGGPEGIGGLIDLDIWNAEQRKLISASTPMQDCPCCGNSEFPFLAATSDLTTTLCGRNTVQVQARGETVDLASAAKKLSSVGEVRVSPWFVKCQLREPADLELTLFADSRLLVKGTNDLGRAKSVYARFVGS